MNPTEAQKEKARELREEHQNTCSLEQLTIRYGLRSAAEAEALLNKRFDERCAQALADEAEQAQRYWRKDLARQLDEAARLARREENEACAEIVDGCKVYNSPEGFEKNEVEQVLCELAADIRARAKAAT